PLDIGNSGTAPMEISWMQMQDGTTGLSIQVYMLIDGWFGPEWTWVDIAEAYSPWNWNPPVFKLNPGDKLPVRAIFYPSANGEYADVANFTTTIGDQQISF